MFSGISMTASTRREVVGSSVVGQKVGQGEGRVGRAVLVGMGRAVAVGRVLGEGVEGEVGEAVAGVTVSGVAVPVGEPAQESSSRDKIVRVSRLLVV
jgi:hypothetical protein